MFKIQKQNNLFMDNCQQIADLCLQYFNNLSKSGKPDPQKEYTVLAAIVCDYKNDEKANKEKGEVVVLTTGTKCHPSNECDKNERIVDSHAESLLKRGFKRYLISLLKSGFNLDRISSVSLFVSQLPCGSIQRWKGDSFEQLSQSCSNRKPGRGEVCRRATCLMKITKWVYMGLQGRRLIQLTGRPIRINNIIIGNCGPIGEYNQQMVNNWFQLEDRCMTYKPFDLNFVPKIQFCEDFRNELFIKCDSKQSTPTSIIMWLTTDGQRVEVITDGHKLGVTNKNVSKNKLLISDSIINRDIDLIDREKDLKLSEIYEKQWNELKRSRLFDVWLTNT